MTEETGRADIYAAMAEVEDFEAAERAARNPFAKRGDQSNQKHSHMVTTPEGPVEVPSMAYVRELERTVREQAKVIAKFERQFHRIASTLRGHRNTINAHSSRINDTHRELDQKIDRRD